MGQIPGICEIVESKEEDIIQHSNGTTPSSSESRVDDKPGKLPKLKTGHKFSVDDDLNQLFEAIVLRTKARGLGLSHQLGTDSSRKDVLKNPIRVGVPQASGIGISESVNLKQALRGLRISHASEMAAMKRLSKPAGLPGVSEAGSIKRLYRAVVVEASESGFPLDEGKGSLVEISLVPEKSTFSSEKKSVSLQGPKTKSAHSSPQSVVGMATTVSVANTLLKDEIVTVPTEVGRETSTFKLWNQRLKSTPLSSRNTSNKALEINEIVPASAEIGCETSMLELGRNVKPHFSPLSSSSTGSKASKSVGNCPRVVKPIVRKKCFVKKRVKQDPSSTSSSSNTQNEDDSVGWEPNMSKLVCRTHNCNQKKVSKESTSPPSSSASPSVEDCLSNADSGANKPDFSSNRCNDRPVCANVNVSSRSREKGEFSQSSKFSIGECSSSTSISEESYPSGSSCSGSRPHMSKDLRWDAIHRVEMQHGSLGLRHFKLLKRLGCGDIGTVYLAELTRTNCLFALKVMDNEFLGSSKKMPRAQTEREIMQMLDHPFLPTLFAHFTTDKFSCLVMEYCPGGDMHVLRQRQPSNCFTEQAARFYAAEVLLALEYLHMLGVVYRDLKPENILIREDGHIMLSDFDLALRCTVSPTLVTSSSSVTDPTKKFSGPCMESKCLDPFCLQPSWPQVSCFTPRLISGMTKTKKLKSDQGAQSNPFPQLVAEPTSARSNSFVGTHEYLAPEIIKGEGHGNAVDWWTFGIFLYELLFGKTPFQGLGNDDTLANVVLHGLKFPDRPRVGFQARDLIRRLLIKEPKKRLGSVKGATEIRRHPFFEGLNWALIRCAVPPELPKSCDPLVPVACEQEESKSVEFRMSGEAVEFELF